MKNALKIGFIALAFVAVSCQKDDDGTMQEQENNLVILNNNNLTERVKFPPIGVISMKGAPETPPAENSSLYKNGQGANDLPLAKIAEIAAPSYQGIDLRATHVALNGNFAYVSYNVEGNTYQGAVDVINVTDPRNPTIASQAVFPNTDISSLTYYNGSLYLAGATPSINNDGANPAFIFRMELQDGLPTENVSVIDMPGYVSTDIIANSDGIFAVSGDNGVVAHYNLDFETLEESTPLTDLRALGQYNNKIVALSGTEGIHVYNTSNLNETNSFPTSQDIAESKRTIDFYDNNVLVSEGMEGTGVYNINNGNKLATIEIPTEYLDEGTDPNDVVTNAVSVEENHAFVASGAAGLTVYNLEEGVSNIQNIGTLNLSGSANYVKSSEDYIFVADGTGGLKIIEMISQGENNSLDCSLFPEYTGSLWLNVNSNDEQAYSGSASLMGVNVNSNSTLTFCGAFAVSKGINVNSGGTFLAQGSLVQGSTESPWNSLNVNNNGTLKIEGSLVVYGNMILNNGATLEFLGSNSSITVYGSVIQNGNVTIIGDYIDTFNSL